MCDHQAFLIVFKGQSCTITEIMGLILSLKNLSVTNFGQKKLSSERITSFMATTTTLVDSWFKDAFNSHIPLNILKQNR